MMVPKPREVPVMNQVWLFVFMGVVGFEFGGDG
jgi:hypothetical protein